MLDALNFNLFSLGFLSDGCILYYYYRATRTRTDPAGRRERGNATGVAAILRRDVTWRVSRACGVATSPSVHSAVLPVAAHFCCAIIIMKAAHRFLYATEDREKTVTWPGKRRWRVGRAREYYGVRATGSTRRYRIAQSLHPTKYTNIIESYITNRLRFLLVSDKIVALIKFRYLVVHAFYYFRILKNH